MISGMCYGVFGGVSQPLCLAEALRGATPGKTGIASGVFYLGTDLGVTIGSTFWGVVIDSFGYAWMFIIDAVVVVLTALAALALLRK